ncbi:vWA domain-containing protein [Lacibacterium aquatile]|uniref:VWA domain-containing protein n=1 Tax=Lacibacterium aquatile TaxID=1168082 RepID=A0ABW5DVA2_9PROT
MKKLATSLALALLLAAPQAVAQARTPLLIEGKTTLYQKILTRPGAKLIDKPGASGGKVLAPMSVLFVYGRKDGLVEVGAASDGKVQGFLTEAETIPWQHTLVMGFANPAGRDRVLFYKERDGLMATLTAEKPADAAAPQRKAIADNKLPADSPVISIEPENTVDLQKQFYLLPILEAKSAVLPSGFRVRTVRVASVTKDDKPVQAQRVNPSDALKDFRSGVVFVVDASSSMQPYIDRTRQAVSEVFDRVEAAKLNDKVRFGMVAYRDDPSEVKGIEYLAKTFADPNKASTKADFLKAAEGVKASTISTRAFAEDGYAGLEHALRGIDWDGFGGKFIVMITDASSREGNSPLSATKLSTDQMRQMAQENGTAIYVLHQLTAEGKGDHAAAKSQYERLSNYPGTGSLYFPVPSGDPEAFKAEVKQLADLLVDQVRKAGDPNAKPDAKPTDDKLAKTTEAVGHAMRLAYLGKAQNTAAPSMFEAWASDRDFAKPDVAAFSVRVLLTKNQLSDLQATLRRIVEAGEKAQLQPGDFFNQLRSAAAAMGRDPGKIGQGQVRNLEQAGLMGEYLDGLPYQSKLMALDEDSWSRMGVGEQQAVIDDIKSKVALYQRYHDDVDRWVKLADGAGAGDTVYPVPIDSLP